MKTKIEIEKYESSVTRIRRGRTVFYFCRKCTSELPHFSVVGTAFILQMSETAVFRLIESGEVHSLESANGLLYICENSVSALKQRITFFKQEF